MCFFCACLLPCKCFFMVFFVFVLCILMRFLHLSSQYSLCTVSMVVTVLSEFTVVY